jgi:cell division protein FtsB
MAYRKKRVSHGKEVYYILSIVAAVLAAVFAIWGPGGYVEMKKTQLQLETHRARIEALQRGNREKMQSIQALRSDKKTLEKYAREKGYSKKGEIIQQMPQQAPAEK